jgi:hypothetical protein
MRIEVRDEVMRLFYFYGQAIWKGEWAVFWEGVRLTS